MVKTGMAKAGYIFVNIDDCWQVSRTQNGTIVADPQRFPSGIPALATFVHGLGLKLGAHRFVVLSLVQQHTFLFSGIYSDAGYKTCAGRPGSLGFEKIDAATYAAWGIDYLKYDNCNTDNSIPEKRYPVMRDALNATGKPIFFSMCEWGVDNPATYESLHRVHVLHLI
jgi:alpha-galactosidase